MIFFKSFTPACFPPQKSQTWWQISHLPNTGVIFVFKEVWYVHQIGLIIWLRTNVFMMNEVCGYDTTNVTFCLKKNRLRLYNKWLLFCKYRTECGKYQLWPGQKSRDKILLLFCDKYQVWPVQKRDSVFLWQISIQKTYDEDLWNQNLDIYVCIC